MVMTKQQPSKNTKVKTRLAGMLDRRIYPRLKIGLPVRFSVASASRDTSRAQRRVFRSLSQNISIDGIQIIVQDKALFELRMSCRLWLEIIMPKHSGIINCMGALRNIAKRRECLDLRYLCVEFIELPRSQRKKLERLFVN